MYYMIDWLLTNNAHFVSVAGLFSAWCQVVSLKSQLGTQVWWGCGAVPPCPAKNPWLGVIQQFLSYLHLKLNGFFWNPIWSDSLALPNWVLWSIQLLIKDQVSFFLYFNLHAFTIYSHKLMARILLLSHSWTKLFLFYYLHSSF